MQKEPQAAHLVSLLQKRAREQHDQRAYTFLSDDGTEKARLTYGQLDQQARSLAAILQRQAGAAPALMLYPPGLDYIVAFFGCLYADVIAVPAYPPSSNRSLERIEAIIADAGAGVVLTTGHIRGQIQQRISLVPQLEALQWIATDQLPQNEHLWQDPLITGENLAFLQYTSGSTGVPKGVMVSHRNLLMNSALMCDRWQHTPQSVGVSWLPIFHDMGLIAGVLQPLYAGFLGVLMSPAAFLQRPLRWLQAISRYRGTTSCAPNFAYELCIRHTTAEERADLDLSSWLVAVNGAEPVRWETLKRFAETFAVAGFRAETMTPGYGLAESTLMVSSTQIDVPPLAISVDKEKLAAHHVVEVPENDALAQLLVGCGYVGKDHVVRIVEPEMMTLCAEREVGEIWVAGPSVTGGYWKRDEETKRTFKAYVAETGEGPFLRTGDLGFLWHGELFITGRLKDLIIIRGRNHYPQDIEYTVERSSPMLRAGCGAAFAVEVENEEQLVIVQEVHRSCKDLDGLGLKIRQAVAEYHELQVHTIALVKHGTIPKTTSGKIQRRATLSAFLAGKLNVLVCDTVSVAADSEVRPALTREEALAVSPSERISLIEAYLFSLLRGILRIEHQQLDRHASLRTLALDSLMAARISGQIEADLGIPIPLVMFLQEGSVRDLAAEIVEQLAIRGESFPLPGPLPDERVTFPSSFAQEQLWFLHYLEPESTAYHLPFALSIQGVLSISLLERSIQWILQRHETLRTGLETNEHGDLLQMVQPPAYFPLPVIDLRSYPAEDRQAEVERHLAQTTAASFDLAQGLLLRAQLFHLKDEEYLLLIVAHHLACDGQSIQIFIQELGTIYAAFCQGKEDVLQPLPFQYKNYVQWQRQQADSAHQEVSLNYWKQQLQNLPTLSLPTEHHGVSVPRRYQGAIEHLELSPEMLQRLRALSHQEGTTLFMILMAAFQVLLMRYSGQEDIVVGTTISQRSRPELESMIGFFVNTLLLRCDLSGEPGFRSVLHRVRQVCLDAYTHQDIPFQQLVKELQPRRDKERNPLFQVMFTLQSAPPEEIALPDLHVSLVEVEGKSPPFDLVWMLFESETALSGHIEYRADLFEQAFIRRMLEHFQELLKSILRSPDQPVTLLPLLPPYEQAQILDDWNPPIDYSQVLYLHELIELQVERTPEEIAVRFAGVDLTYRDLNTRANQLAHYLKKQGSSLDTCIGICMYRSLEMVVGILAILKAGGAYLPLDPDIPQSRLEFFLQDSQVSVVLTQEILQAVLPEGIAQVICVDSNWGEIALEPGENLSCALLPQQLAYVIYTSGSTGLPKGAMNTHQGICNRLLWMQEAYQLSAHDIVLQKTPYSFDVSVWEFFWPLMVGARLVLAAPGGHRDSAYLVSLIQEERISTLHFVPSMLGTFLETAQLEPQNCNSLRRVLCSGERLSLALQKRFYSIFDTELHNLYGPTEASVDVTFWPCQRMDRLDVVPIGYPIANTRIYLLDTHLQMVPVGIVGEVYIGGIGLARGYWQRPELTAECFIPDHLSKEPGARLYKTGDLARYLPGGAIDYIGRVDYQVKIRGHRIELGEIEAVLRSSPLVQDCIVQSVEHNQEDRFLTAYIVAREEAQTRKDLRHFLFTRLPEYMVPTTFMFISSLPLNSNGKVDRRALPIPEQFSVLEAAFVPAHDPIEEMLVTIWQNVLGIEKISMRDNFFELGGHSLLVSRVIARLWSVFHIRLAFRDLFEAQTLAEQAELIRGLLQGNLAHSEEMFPKPVPFVDEAPRLLSFAQQRIWFLHQLEPESSFYTIPLVLRLRGRLDRDALKQSFQHVVERHEVLRTTFVASNGQPVAIIHPPKAVEIPLYDLTSLPPEVNEAEISRWSRLEAQRPFDLEQGPLFRITLLRSTEQKHVLLLSMHHIIADGASLEILLQELQEHYRALVERRVITLEPLAFQYSDYARWQYQRGQSQELEQSLIYWQEQLANAPAVLDLPLDNSRPVVQRFKGSLEHFAIPEELVQQIKLLGQQEGVTLFMTLLAAFQVLLMRYSGQKDLLIGTPMTNRTRPELERLIGLFVNTLVLRTDLAGDPSFRALLHRVRSVCLDAYSYQDLPFEQVVEKVQPARHLSYNPLFQVMFSLQQAPWTTSQLVDLTLELEEGERHSTKCDLSLVLLDDGHGLRGTLEYCTDLFEAPTIQRLCQHFLTLLEDIVIEPDQAISRLTILTETERQHLLHCQQVTREYPHHRFVHQLVEACAEQTPNALAIQGNDWNLSYKELNEQANRLAHYLRQQRIGPEQCVGICLERSDWLVIAQLATLKAGGAYISLDPSLPVERLRFMLTDSQAILVLTSQKQAEALGACLIPFFCIDSQLADLRGMEITNLGDVLDTKNLAYIIYTSGSTGQPKGVQLTHEGLLNLIYWHQHAYQVCRADRASQLASVGFDASVWEIWSYLTAGASLHFPDETTRVSASILKDWLVHQQITLCFAPTPLAEQLLEEEWPETVSLRYLLTGGDQLRHVSTNLPFALFNHYGPTESTVVATAGEVVSALGRHAQKPPSIGGPIDNVQLYLLDQHLQLVPSGVVGEIYLGGAGLARGYVQREDSTAQSFLPDPYSPLPGARMYRTGDLARYLPDGQVEFYGRGDNQVKVRGFRIELGEIEAVLQAHQSVHEALVQVDTNPAGNSQLVAYFIPASPSVSVEELEHWLRQHLPPYMIPSFYISQEHWPLTRNGKIDQDALPPPIYQTLSEKAFEAPRTAIEEVIADIWAQTLHLERISIRDNFFKVGGHSLLATQIISRIHKQLKVKIPLQTFFAEATVESISQTILRHERHAGQSERIAKILRKISGLSLEEKQAMLAEKYTKGE